MSGTVTVWGTVASTANNTNLNPVAMQESYDAWFATLPTTLPSTPATYWNNSNTLAKTP